MRKDKQSAEELTMLIGALDVVGLSEDQLIVGYDAVKAAQGEYCEL